MAKDSDDCEFWLPPQFLNDDDDLFTELKGHKNDGRNGLGFGGDYQRGYSSGFYGFGPNSDLSSPVDGSTETESDEEDYITELTRKMSRSTLLDCGLAYENRKVVSGLLFSVFSCFFFVYSYILTNTRLFFSCVYFSFAFKNISGVEFIRFAAINALQCFGWLRL